MNINTTSSQAFEGINQDKLHFMLKNNYPPVQSNYGFIFNNTFSTPTIFVSNILNYYDTLNYDYDTLNLNHYDTLKPL